MVMPASFRASFATFPFSEIVEDAILRDPRTSFPVTQSIGFQPTRFSQFYSRFFVHLLILD